MQLRCLVATFLLATGALGVPLKPGTSVPYDASSQPGIGVEFDQGDDGLPLLKLPYTHVRASKYDRRSDLYTFKNIRFAAPPTGDLRFSKPAPPVVDTSVVNDGSYGPQCPQSLSLKGFNLIGNRNDFPIGGAVNQFLGGIPLPLSTEADEDCLFLDVYVPGKALRGEKKDLAVVVWIFGGAFLFGSKDMFGPFYSGEGIIEESDGNLIFVAGNYRVGAFGWLAGSSMERDGAPNAGLHDQRAVFEWVQSYIHLFGGDPTAVSAWGESAGAGSILHHLIAKGGQHDPLFKRVIVQSPAYQINFDRRGAAEEVFQAYAKLAGCEGQGLECLRTASTERLQKANLNLQASAVSGVFMVGPATDGEYVRQLPALELASGSYWKGIESMIISHTENEARLFVDGGIQTNDDFDAFIDEAFPDYTKSCGINKVIKEFYPPPSILPGGFASQTSRVEDMIRDLGFTSHTRMLTDAYRGKTYNMQYSVGPGWHATDLFPTFYNFNLRHDLLPPNLRFPLMPRWGAYARVYQSYFASHARTGDPNQYSKKLYIPAAIHWPHPENLDDEKYTKVLNAGDLGFSLITDSENPKSRTEFWTDVAAAVTNCGGYAVPGTVQSQSLVAFTGDASANYATP